jgi:hypothetical protein
VELDKTPTKVPMIVFIIGFPGVMIFKIEKMKNIINAPSIAIIVKKLL